ncbi:MAG: DEAD/DEAH box helicase [Chloroflexi bacterium]|nr:DEAD/DEAH box helicase [Chloroflexota bacterium]
MASTFEELGLGAATLRAIAELGYEEPTPIQEQTIRLMLEGADVIAQAPTGTGKTGAFALPVIEHLDPGLRAPQALVLTPTRELAVQVAEAFHTYGRYAQTSVLPVYGGQPIDRQLRALKEGVQVVVGTPGRLGDHIRRGTLRLGQVHTVILDEADEMLDMGFKEEIEAVLKEVPDVRQTALFSATIPPAIADLARRYLHEPQRITVSGEQMIVPEIRQTYYEVGRRDKFEVLVRILDYETPSSAIIFCRTKKEVDELGQRLVGRAYPAETLHGDLNQTQRDRVMARFRSGQVELLIATDVAARGLDIEHVSHVINYNIPQDPESYVHRIGRTGRAGRTGCAITLVTPRERNLWQMIQRVTDAPVQRQAVPTIADVIGRRREAFKETLRETISQGDLEPYIVMAENLGEEYSPTELAAAAFKLLLGTPPDEIEDRLAVAEPEEPRRDGKPRVKRHRERERERGPLRPTHGMTRLYIGVGREDGVRPGDIVGAIANEADIPGRSIGAIEIYDGFSFVDVPSNQAEHILRALRQTTIRNHRVTASVAKPTRTER